jgi:hypothetical protein
MARLHILQQSGINVYGVVVHAPTPVGNNSAGVPWSVAIQNAGFANTSLPVGNGPGQITQAEANQVEAGTLIEARFQWGNDPSWTNQERQDDLAVRAQQAVDDVTANLVARLKFFGFTVA